MNKNKSSQQGVALIAAIFLIVVIGLAVVVMSILATRNTQQNTQSLLQMRAQTAAGAGLEYAVQQLIETNACSNESNISLTGFTGFLVSIECNQSIHNRPSQQISLFEIRATAEYGEESAADYVWSKLTSTVEL